MNAHIDYHISEQAGRRYAVVPLEQFTELVERAGEVDALTLPHEVVSRHLTDDLPLLRCWREYLGMTQAELAERMKVSQAQVAQWERPTARPRHATLKKAAAALGIHVSQLTLND
ncbi:helix-turn-helix transcriptional regulator [Halomonas daqingensis]|uniref:Helix-turn-helix transcriptional regulator n=1 Tax=Billgrantia desiderata TaxID=52021 RepID=A0ABS9B0I3_9GAMM|nr:helix-turn-helix transcriptional regulator [Halomonas desiderata]MCE8040940.1 helix-turn-helix transcriptional regulator [Halomonas desiderata]MCE8045515.1 helix-turn-helix transcriptional regulator [Halomonas desiderata]